jgi:predicted phage terminase large subunit-like protein
VLRRPRRHGHALCYCYYDDGLRRRSVNKWLTKAEGAACRSTSTSYRRAAESPTCENIQSAVSARCRRTIAITHVARGKWTALDREQQIKTWTEIDANTWRTYQVGVEQEPGSGGKESAEATVRNLMGYRVFVDKVTGKKEIRVEPFCAQVQGGNLFVAGGPWVQLLLDEFEVWPQGTKDQVDACSGAFNHLSKAIGGNSFIV